MIIFVSWFAFLSCLAHVLLENPVNETDTGHGQVPHHELKGGGTIDVTAGAFHKAAYGFRLVDDPKTGKESTDDAKAGGTEPPAVDGVHDDRTPDHGGKGATAAHGKLSWDLILGLPVGVNVVTNTKEETKEDGRMMAFGDVLRTFFTNHDAKDENNGTCKKGKDKNCQSTSKQSKSSK
jgi:hypothetical protein